LYFENERSASALVVTETMYICASLDNPGSLSYVLFQNVAMSVSVILVTGELLNASSPMTSTYLTNSVTVFVVRI